MSLLRFDPDNLQSSLAALDTRCRVAFALSCSLRSSLSATPSQSLAELARRLAQKYANGEKVDLHVAESLLAELGQSAELDRDDVACSYYALHAAAREDIDSVIWAAQRAYDSKNALAQEALGITNYTGETEVLILQHQAVQNELSDQAADLVALQAGHSAIPLVIQHAQSAA